MPSVRGFLRSKPKTDDGEGELAESQLVARLAGLFGEMAVDTVDANGHLPAETATNGATLPHDIVVPAGAPPEHATNGARHPDRPYLGRPPIIVIGNEPIIVPAPDPIEEPVAESIEPAGALGASELSAPPELPADEPPGWIVEPVGVMAQAGEDVGEDPWRLPGQPEPALAAKPLRKRSSRAGRARKVASAMTSAPVAPAAELEVGAAPVAEVPVADAAQASVADKTQASVAAPEPEVASVAVAEATFGVTAADVETAPDPAREMVREPAAEPEIAPVARLEVAEPVVASPVEAPPRRSHKKREAVVAVVAKASRAPTATTPVAPKVKARPAAMVKSATVVKPAARPKPPVTAKAGPMAKSAVPPTPAVPAKPVNPTRPAVLAAVHCPYCGVALDPPPAASRKCEECQQRIIVKRIDGRSVYLAGAALPVFTAERRRVANSARLTRERGRWLDLASSAGAPSRAVAQLRIARPTDANVDAARELYLLAVERTVRMAKRDKEWEAAARLRRDEAGAIYRAEGSPRPPSAEVVELYRDGVASELRGIAEISRDAQLVAASCCDACRNDDEVVTRIATELRQPRLPHADCPKGLCRCHWDLAARDRTTLLRYLRRRSPSASRASSSETPPAR